MNLNTEAIGTLLGSAGRILGEVNNILGQVSTDTSSVMNVTDLGLECKIPIPGLGKEDMKIVLTGDGKLLKIFNKADDTLLKAYRVAEGFDVKKIKVSALNGLLTVFIPRKQQEKETEIIVG